MPVISIRDASFKYPGQNGQALNHLSLDIHGGEMLLVLGGDCSGKSTFCKLLNGLIPHEVKGEFSGEVLLNGRSTKSMSTGEIVRDVGLALQDPDVQLFTDSVEGRSLSDRRTSACMSTRSTRTCRARSR